MTTATKLHICGNHNVKGEVNKRQVSSCKTSSIVSLIHGCQHKIGFSDNVLSALVLASECDVLPVTIHIGLDVTVERLKKSGVPDIGIYYSCATKHEEWINAFDVKITEIATLLTTVLR